MNGRTKGEPGTARRIGRGGAPKIDPMQGRELAIVYLAAGAVMLAIMITMIVLGYLLIAGIAFLAGITACLTAAGYLVSEERQDPE